MTYKLNPEIRKITSKVVLQLPEGTRMTFDNGEAAYDAVFEERYVVKEMKAVDSEVVINLEIAGRPDDDVTFF